MSAQWVVIDNSKTFRQDNELLARNLVLLNGFPNNDLRDSLQ